MYASQNSKDAAGIGSSQTYYSGVDVAGKIAEPRAPIDAGMSALQDRIETLFRLTSTIESKFGGVLRASPPNTAPTPRQVEVPASSPVGSLLSERIGQLRDLEYRLEDILARCEL